MLRIDADDRPDLLFVNGRDWTARPEIATRHGLFRNNGDGTFRDVLPGSGLDRTSLYGLGASVADYDNDGRDDVFVTAVDGGRLFHNDGNGRFSDVTAAAGIRNTDFSVTPRTHPFLGEGAVREAWGRLEGLPTGTPDPDRWLALIELAQAETRAGQLTEALDHLTQALSIVRRAGDPIALAPYTNSNLFHLGVALLRLGETQNCTEHNRATSCILPLRGDNVHANQEASRRAIDMFTQGLKGQPNDDLRLSFRWLINLAYMTVGAYPHEVPKDYLTPSTAFESDEPFPRFANNAPALGLDAVNNSGGAIGDDFDGDGLLDLVVSTWDPRVSLRLYKNNGDGTFSDRSAVAGLVGVAGGLNMVQADYNNDGRTDILVLRGAWLGAQGQHPKSLLRNNGDGTFLEVARTAGVTNDRYAKAAVWGDVDGDRLSDRGVRRSIYRHVNSGGSFGANPLRQTIGLGRATIIDRLEIYWPTSNQTQTFRQVPVGRLLQITEGDTRYTTTATKRFSFAPRNVGSRSAGKP